MQRIEWDDSLAVGVDMIDEQHQTWISRYNSVLDAIEERHGAEIVSKILGFLVDYTETHFAAEEARMAETNYPEMEEHMAKHKELLGTLDGLVQDFREDGPTEVLAEAVDTFLGNWLIKHIRDVDTKLGAFLAER